MARVIDNRDIAATLAAADQWLNTCLVEDGSLFSTAHLWTTSLLHEVHQAFVEHPDFGDADFITKLKGQMKNASPSAKQLMAELLWALLLFPSNVKPKRKREQVCEIWALSGEQLNEKHPLLADEVLAGIGSGGPGFNTYRPNELSYLIALTRDLKGRDVENRRRIFKEYDTFIEWIQTVPRRI